MAFSWEADPPKTPQDFAQYLLSESIITEEQLSVASNKTKENKFTFEESLVALGFVNEPALATAKADFCAQARGSLNKTLPISHSQSSGSIVRIIDDLVYDAIRRGVTDIHFEPEKAYLRVRYRLDGHLHLIRTFHIASWQAKAVRIKVLAGMNIAETRKPQSGRFLTSNQIDIRVSSHPTLHGENIVMRILDAKGSLKSINCLGFSEEMIERVRNIVAAPEGLILVTGPTGSGKTTSIYAMLQLINRLSINIMTLEDPVEYTLPLVRHAQVDLNFSFAVGVKSILRQDPDVIVIGEIRDEDTAQMAMRAAMTGQLVFASLHTQNPLGVLSRLSDLGVKPQLVGEYVVGILTQRLIRRLCLSCKRSYAQGHLEAEYLAWAEHKILLKAEGCRDCFQTGYNGRIACGELLLLSEPVRQMIDANQPIHILQSYLTQQGHRTFLDEAQRAILSGKSSLEEYTQLLRPGDRV